MNQSPTDFEVLYCIDMASVYFPKKNVYELYRDNFLSVGSPRNFAQFYVRKQILINKKMIEIVDLNPPGTEPEKRDIFKLVPRLSEFGYRYYKVLSKEIIDEYEKTLQSL